MATFQMKEAMAARAHQPLRRRKSSGERPSAWYALRRTLPPVSVDRNLQELIDCLPAYGVDELIVMVDTGDFNHGHPPLEWLEAYLPQLHRIRAAMREIGVRYSLNPWVTLGHCDHGYDMRKRLAEFTGCVGHDGAQCIECACPLCPAWRDHIIKLWTLYGQTRPYVLWIEDDMRTFNHAPARYGCFCDEHLRRFSQRVNSEVTRPKLVEAILHPGPPHPWRKEYLDMQAEIMIETVTFLAKTVHQASPRTQLGLMSSGPRNHCLEGRRWSDFAAAIADGGTLYSRPPLGNYSESSLRGFYYSHDSIKLTRHCVGEDAVEQTEVENHPCTRYSKSEVFTFLEMALSFAYGCAGVTLALFDSAGTPMRLEPGMGRMLGRVKPFLNALAQRAGRTGRYRGVRVLFDATESYHRRLPAHADYGALSADGASSARLLEAHGIATVYDDEKVVCATGQTLRALEEEAIRELLGRGRGLLLDGTAAEILFERGFGKLIGLKKIHPPESIDRWPGRPYGAEELFNPQFGGAPGRFLTLALPDLGRGALAARMEPLEEAIVASRVCDPDARGHAPCSYAYENRQGGRVFVHALDWHSADGVSFYHPFRAMQLQSAMDWLSWGHPPLTVRGDGVYPLGFRKDCADGLLLGMFNLTLDPWPGVEFTLGDCPPIESPRYLTAEGHWKNEVAATIETRGDSTRVVRVDRPIPFDQPLFLWWNWK